MTADPGFEFVTETDVEPPSRVVAGFAGPDLAGLTAVDYLIHTYNSKQVGHVRTRGLPDVAIVREGRPRHPVRIYSLRELSMTVITSDVFVPVSLADRFADSLSEWLAGIDASSFTLLHGAQFPHAETEHIPFFVGTEPYRDTVVVEHLAELPIGMLDGVVGEVLLRSHEQTFQPAGVIVTPAHLPGPDIEAAVSILDGLSTIFGIEIDVTALRERSERLREYYEGVADRIESLKDGGGTAITRDFPEDRMYM